LRDGSITDVTVDRPHHANPREHRWPVVFGHQYQRFHGGLPFFDLRSGYSLGSSNVG
jgi:hypothetical protein